MSETSYQHAPDQPWIFRTYAGHTTAEKSNALYKTNLAKGQTGLSIAFDLPTQTGYDPDHILARGEVGKVGVPVSHLGDMRTLFDGLPLAEMNTSMTINAPAAWLLALYVAVADEQGAARKALRGTTQNDVIKEYLSRGTYIFPPAPSLKLTADTIAWCLHETPKWNPMNVCSYHLQEAGATPEQELSFALATAIAILDEVRARGEVREEEFPAVFGRISFFVNAGIRIVTEMCKMRAFTELWEEIGRERYGVSDETMLRFRYGVQVNSLGLTEPQPENNVYRILLEALAVTLSKRARCRALQLPAWNEALGLPRPWDQQWSLRIQQILAYETDLLEFEDLFDGSPVVEAKVTDLMALARAELARLDRLGDMQERVETMKADLVASHKQRIAAIETGAQTIVGVNRFTETEQSPLSAGEGLIEKVDPLIESAQIEKLKAWRAQRDANAWEAAMAELRAAASEDRNIMEASIAAAKAGATTGEWAAALREVYGEYRAPTGVSAAAAAAAEPRGEAVSALRARLAALAETLGAAPKLVLGKPGLDGHSNGAEQIAIRAAECGFEVVYEGIRQTPDFIVARAKEEGAHVIALSILSGSHMELVRAVSQAMDREGLSHLPLFVGGIIPDADVGALGNMRVAQVFTPKNFDLTQCVGAMVGVLEQRLASAGNAGA